MRRRGAISSLAKNICCSESFYTWQHAAEDLLHAGEEKGGGGGGGVAKERKKAHMFMYRNNV